MIDEAKILSKYNALKAHLDEKTRRLWAASEASSLPYGGISVVSRVTQISRRAIHRGIKEIATPEIVPKNRIRKLGAGRKTAVDIYADLPTQLEKLIEPLTRGNPESPLRWTCKSTRRLSEELKKIGYIVSSRVVRKLLHEMGYSLQGNKKTLEGKTHPDRNAQFEYINEKVENSIKGNDPVISVDTKKKEILGNYANKGVKWCQKGDAPEVADHDFATPETPRAYPYGIYDINKNVGFVNLGQDHDTATFAVSSIKKWWTQQGRKAYPNAKNLFITADAGGSNGYRIRLWKYELQKFATKIKMPISVSHFPPGTSKWNKVEHRLFSFISQNWKGTPLADHETVVNLISSTTTTKGLKVICKLDKNKYPIGIKVDENKYDSINIMRSDFHGDWNYTIYPN